MDWLELIKYIAGLLPPGILGAVIVVVIMLWMNGSKKIPLSISWGARTNGKSYVTVEEMRANCEKRQEKLDTRLLSMDGKLDKIIDKQGEHGERLANLEGRFYHQRVGD